MKKKIYPCIIILFISAISILLSHYCGYSECDIITSEFVLTTTITLFSIALAIVALLFTVLDRYKNSAVNPVQFIERECSVLTEISNGSISLLIVTITLVIATLLQDLLHKITLFDVYESLLIFSLLFSLIEMLDIAISVHLLVSKIKNFTDVTDDTFKVSVNERNIIESCRKLNSQSTRELIEYIKTLIIKQNLK